MGRHALTQALAVASTLVSLASLLLVADQIARIDQLEQQNHTSNTCTPCTTTDTPVVPPQTDDITTSGDNKMYGGVDWCTTIPGVYITPKQWALDHADTICPALTTYGATLMNGDLILTGDALVLIDKTTNKFINLTKFLIDYLATNTDVCPDECLNGASFNPFDCSCTCTDFYTGTQCETPTCAPYGVYTPETNACVCNISVPDNIAIDTQCRPAQIRNVVTSTGTPTCPGCFGHCLFINNVATCVCTNDAELGDNCEYQCATKTIDNFKCPPRDNWGLDGCYELEPGLHSCVCGGGYTWGTESTVQIAELRCTDSTCLQAFEANAHLCCAPGITCQQTKCTSTDSDCCVDFSHSEIGCITAGCTFCNVTATLNNITYTTQTTCAATAYVSEAAYTSGKCSAISPYVVSGNWNVWQYDCTDFSLNDICDRATRATYLGVYLETCNDTITTACLLDARQQINALPWSRLSTGVGFREQLPYHAALFAPPGYGPIATLPYSKNSNHNAPTLCVPDHPTLTYYASLGMFVSDLGLATATRKLGYTCLTNFYIITTVLEDGTIAYYTFMLSTTTPFRYCLAKQETLTRANLIRYFGTPTIDPNTQVWRQLYNTELGAYKSYEYYCQPTNLADFSFGVWPTYQPTVLGLQNFATTQMLTATYSTSIQANLISTPAYIDIPFMSDTCPIPCRSTAGCAVTDLDCLRAKAITVSWVICCFCMWKHAATYVHCF